MERLRYIDEENRVLNPYARDIEPQAGDKGWGQLCLMKAIDTDRRRIEAVLSSDHLDRYGEIIEAKAYGDFLDQFNGQNALLDSHDHTEQIGHWEDMQITSHTFEGWAVFDQSPDNATASRTWGLHVGKHRKTFSVGFIGHKYDMRKVELPDGQTSRVRVWTVAEPVEGSSVAVPANPQAMAKALQRFAEAEQTTDTPFDLDQLLSKVNDAVAKNYQQRIEKLLSPEPGSDLALLIQSVVEQTVRSQGNLGQPFLTDTSGGDDVKAIVAQLERMLGRTR